MFRQIIFIAAMIGIMLFVTACSSNPYERNNFIAANSEAVELGKQIYNEKCAECHGDTGEGGTLAADHSSIGSTWYHADDVLLNVIYYGGSIEVPEDDRMPAYIDELTTQEAEAVLIYIKTFWSDEERELQQQRTDAARGK